MIGHGVFWVLFFPFFALMLLRVRELYERGCCPECGGREKHRKGCKLDER